MKMLKAKVHGNFQGVWFRKYTLICINRFGIASIVKNLDDGSVLFYAKGKKPCGIKKYLKIGPLGYDNKNINIRFPLK